jgi:hypothetical protein
MLSVPCSKLTSDDWTPSASPLRRAKRRSNKYDSAEPASVGHVPSYVLIAVMSGPCIYHCRGVNSMRV